MGEGMPQQSGESHGMSRAEYEEREHQKRLRRHKNEHAIPGMNSWLDRMEEQNKKRKEGKGKPTDMQ